MPSCEEAEASEVFVGRLTRAVDRSSRFVVTSSSVSQKQRASSSSITAVEFPDACVHASKQAGKTLDAEPLSEQPVTRPRPPLRCEESGQFLILWRRDSLPAARSGSDLLLPAPLADTSPFVHETSCATALCSLACEEHSRPGRRRRNRFS